MKLVHIPNLGEAIPRKSKVGLLVCNHGFFIGESNVIGTQIVICSQQHDPSKKSGWRLTWFKVVRYGKSETLWYLRDKHGYPIEFVAGRGKGYRYMRIFFQNLRKIVG